MKKHAIVYIVGYAEIVISIFSNSLGDGSNRSDNIVVLLPVSLSPYLHSFPVTSLIASSDSMSLRVGLIFLLISSLQVSRSIS